MSRVPLSRDNIKMEILSSQDESSIAHQDESTMTSYDSNGSYLYKQEQSFGFINNRELAKLVAKRSIYVETMHSIVNRVKADANNLELEEELKLLKLAVQCIDLTTLSGDDTRSNVERLCLKASTAFISRDEQYKTTTHLKCSAVCVYPARVADCLVTLRTKLEDHDINIASVATAFPSGQCGLKSRLAEIVYAVECGANEIDVVINRAAALQSDWATVFQEICEMRNACDSRLDEGHKVHMKVIIAAGDLLGSSPRAIYMASLIAIIAGADFVKTSTGKESVNATLCIGYIMMRAIGDYYRSTGVKIGFKPAGGIRTYKSAMQWLLLVKLMLGEEWLSKDYFRFGASGVLDDIVNRINQVSNSS